jgi:hypothetical protein
MDGIGRNLMKSERGKRGKEDHKGSKETENGIGEG